MAEATKVVSLRLPVRVYDELAARAGHLSVGEYATQVLGEHVGGEPSAFREFKNALVEWVLEAYPNRDYDRHVIFEAFQFAKSDPRLRALHAEAIAGEDGRPSRERRHLLHRQTGQAIKRALGAKVAGRSAPVDPEIAFIESYTFLIPGDGSDSDGAE
jgi:hypothetical protein